VTTPVLWLAYYFPPTGGAGVQRSVALCRELPEHGFLPVVVTGPAASERRDRWTPQDASLTTAAEIHRVTTSEPTDRGGVLVRAGLRPRPWERWWHEGALAASRAAIAASGARAIVATMSPFGSAPVAAQLSRETGLPWIADLRDPWALDEMQVYPSAWHRRREIARMRRLLASAAGVVANTDVASRRIAAACPEAPRPDVIPNGFAPEDFAGPAPPRADDRFRIVHTGYLHTGLGRRLHDRRLAFRGGAAARVDVRTRSHTYLLEALAGLPPALAERVELHLAGVLSADDVAVTAASPAARLVRAPGYLPHADAVALIRSADLLFLPMHRLADGEEASIVPGKTYEYLASGRPILAAVPPGDAARLVEASGRGTVCAPNDVAAMRRAVASHVAGDAQVADGGLDLDELAWPSRAARFADVLGRVTRRRAAAVAIGAALIGGSTASAAAAPGFRVNATSMRCAVVSAEAAPPQMQFVCWRPSTGWNITLSGAGRRAHVARAAAYRGLTTSLPVLRQHRLFVSRAAGRTVFACRGLRGAVRCRNTRGHGFVLRNRTVRRF